MAFKVFADTNIIIDLIEQRDFDLDSIHQIVNLSEAGEIDIYISETVITNALYITKLQGHIEKVLEFTTVLCIGNDIIKKALDSSFKDKEDAILYYGGLHAKMDFFITRDSKHFLNHALVQLPVLAPKALLAKLKAPK